MPIYLYACNECHKEFEAIQKITEDPLTVCEHCGSMSVVRVISANIAHNKPGRNWDGSTGKRCDSAKLNKRKE